MDERTIERLISSFNLLAPRGQELVDRFYAHLFSEHPEVRAMFPRDMKDQKQKLLGSLVLVVKNLRQAEQLRQPLMDMGQRHAGYGTQAEHYPVVRDTLVGVMAEMAGDAWTDQLDRDWRQAVDFVASVMIEGARTATAAEAIARG
ncbi:MAG: flavohemoprotein [Phycisphaerales bacterium]|nr:flavohemoprotein [Phycisphaerales bacterium]